MCNIIFNIFFASYIETCTIYYAYTLCAVYLLDASWLLGFGRRRERAPRAHVALRGAALRGGGPGQQRRPDANRASRPLPGRQRRVPAARGVRPAPGHGSEGGVTPVWHRSQVPVGRGGRGVEPADQRHREGLWRGARAPLGSRQLSL